MLCEGCGVEALVLKTCRRRDGEGSEAGVLCDPCWEPLADSLWIVVGPVAAHGRCRVCGGWSSVRELVEQKQGGKWDAPSGVCSSCVG
jgi:hypothetical protein